MGHATTDPGFFVDSWREAAICFDRTDVDFFPDPHQTARIAIAKALCTVCPVASECLTWAIETGQPQGIWGGYTPPERRAIRRRWLEEIGRAS